MTLLLDSNAFIWWMNDDKRLGQKAKAAIANPLNKVYLSNLTLLECSIKMKIGKLRIDFKAVDAAISDSLFYELRFDTLAARHFVDTPTLTWADPFDIALIAQAIAKRMTLVTSDHNIIETRLDGLQVLDSRR